LSILGIIFFNILGVGWTTQNIGWGATAPMPTLTPFFYLGILIWLITGLLWIILVIKAYQGEKFKLPVVGDIAEKYA
jgi:uncharacterized membrane protein